MLWLKKGHTWLIEGLHLLYVLLMVVLLGWLLESSLVMYVWVAVDEDEPCLAARDTHGSGSGRCVPCASTLSIDSVGTYLAPWLLLGVVEDEPHLAAWTPQYGAMLGTWGLQVCVLHRVRLHVPLYHAWCLRCPVAVGCRGR